jgi:hypothetical protein
MPDYAPLYVVFPVDSDRTDMPWPNMPAALDRRVAGAIEVCVVPSFPNLRVWQIMLPEDARDWLVANAGEFASGRSRILGSTIAEIKANASVPLALRRRIFRRRVQRADGTQVFTTQEDQLAGDVVLEDELPPTRWLGVD